VPKRLVERPKAGFAIPIGQWLRGPLRDWGESLLSESRLKREGYLDSGEVLHLWRDHCSGRRDYACRLWSLLSFQAWLSGQSLAS
jgi:asparagine synthase (glutamine-hydrolysing)